MAGRVSVPYICILLPLLSTDLDHDPALLRSDVVVESYPVDPSEVGVEGMSDWGVGGDGDESQGRGGSGRARSRSRPPTPVSPAYAS